MLETSRGRALYFSLACLGTEQRTLAGALDRESETRLYLGIPGFSLYTRLPTWRWDYKPRVACGEARALPGAPDAGELCLWDLIWIGVIVSQR